MPHHTSETSDAVRHAQIRRSTAECEVRGSDAVCGARAGIAALMPQCRSVRMFGSAALHLAWIACGRLTDSAWGCRLTGYFEPDLNSWDTAAGAVILKEAGGKLTGSRQIHDEKLLQPPAHSTRDVVFEGLSSRLSERTGAGMVAYCVAVVAGAWRSSVALRVRVL
eukprot:1770482-Rhodomonas_salina.1